MANNSYDFTLGKRSVQEAFNLLIASQPTLISLIRRGSNAVATKDEWLEDSLTPLSTAMVSFDTNGDGTGINVASTAGMSAGTLLRFTTAAGADREEIAKVASVDSATELTIVRDYGSSTGATLVSTDIVHVISTPKNEGTTASAGATREPGSNYNYTQIFDRTAKLSRTAMQTMQYGSANTMAYQLNKEMLDIMYELNASTIYGERVERSSSAAGSFGGILSFLRNGNINTTGGAISAAIINAMFKDIYDDGSTTSNFVLLCNTNQAAKISAFNTAGTNPLLNIPQGSTSTGGYISKFIGNLPSINNFNATIVVDPQFPKTKVALLDLNNIEYAYLQDFTTTDATPAGSDYIAQRILGELTLRVKNGTKSHAIATGLNI